MYGLANVSFKYTTQLIVYMPHGMFFSDALHDEAGCMGVRSGVHRRRFSRLVMSYVLLQDALSIIIMLISNPWWS